MTKYSQQYDNKLLEGILDHMANELKSEFGFSTLDEEDTLDIISLFVDNPDKLICILSKLKTPRLYPVKKNLM